jgi:hypothetical protein
VGAHHARFAVFYGNDLERMQTQPIQRVKIGRGGGFTFGHIVEAEAELQKVFNPQCGKIGVDLPLKCHPT